MPVTMWLCTWEVRPKICLKMGNSQPYMMKEESDKVFCVTEEGSGAAVEYSPVCGQI